MTLDLPLIAATALAATQGEWESRTEIGHPGVRVVARPGAFDWICSMQVSNSPQWVENARHIAMASPQNVLALLDRIRELEVVYQAAVEWGDSEEADQLLPKRYECALLESLDVVTPACWLCRSVVNRGTRICRECATTLSPSARTDPPSPK